MSSRAIYSTLTWVALAAGLALPTVLPEVANVLFLVVAGLAVALCARDTAWQSLLKHPGILAPICAIALLCLAFAFTASTPEQALAAIYFTPLLLISPLVALFERAGSVVTPPTIGLMAAVGAVGAAAVALGDSLILGQVRAGTLVNNAIHFATLTLILGFVALAAVSSPKPSIRGLALLAPSLSLLAVLLSGSRGPLFAALPMACLAAGLLLVGGSRRRLLIAVSSLTTILVIAGVAAWFTGVFKRLTVLAELPQFLTSGTTSDHSTMERLHIYGAAWRSFLASPIFGHGLTDLAGAVRAYMPEGVAISDYQHLHNDLADFAVAGGGLGMAAYFLILLAPIWEAIRAPRGPSQRTALYLALVLAAGYFFMGLTNATFGILSQTTLYAFVTALVVHLCRQDACRAATDELTSPAGP